MKRRVTALTLAALSVLGVVAAPSAAGTAPARPGPSSTGPLGSVTLITGDRVTVTGEADGPQGYQVTPGPGRQVSFAIQTFAGHTLVLPSDAAPLIGKGLVDERLFDVTQLLEWEYDDAHRTDIPIMTEGGAPPRAATAGRGLDSVGLTASRVPKARATTAWNSLRPASEARTLASGVSKLWLDGRVSPALDRSVPQIGAPEAWKNGLTGKGVTVAVLDSGYDPGHPDLKGVVTQAANFSDDPDTRDPDGHGTHVASTVAGSGAASGGRYKGVAPDAKIAVGKVFGLDDGRESAVIAGMQWAATEVKARVVNMSLGERDTRALDPLEQAVNILSEQTGTLFVVAAGNGGARQSIDSPGSADAALTVGAVDKNDTLADFSSQGPRVADQAVKPDITAPGVEIVAASAGGGTSDSYIAKSGTSMATPHVAGAAAILAQRHPDWDGSRLKAALMASAEPGEGLTPYRQGTGRVDVARAVAQTVVTDTPNVWTYLTGPRDDEDVTKEVTYTNTSEEPVELKLTEDGPYTLSADHLAVPAGGSASVTLTLDATLQTGVYPGTVTATTGEVTVRGLAGAFIEPESSYVTVTAIGRDDDPLLAVRATLYNFETDERIPLNFFKGVAEARVRPGAWNLFADMFGENGGITVSHRAVPVGRQDVSVTLDARQGRRISLTVDDPAAEPTGASQISLRNTGGNKKFVVRYDIPRGEVYVLSSRQPGLEYLAHQVLTAGGAAAVRYDLADYRAGRIPSDPDRKFRKAGLAQAAVTFRAQNTDAPAEFDRYVALPGENGVLVGSSATAVTTPGTLTNYLTPGHDLRWSGRLAQGEYVLTDLGQRTVRRGRSAELWNAAVTGPTAPSVTRSGDRLTFGLEGLFTDAGTGRAGWDGDVTGAASLVRDGKVLKRSRLENCHLGRACLVADLPADHGTYTASFSAQRDVPYAALSTAIDASWTFTSAHTDDATPLALPSIRYAPQGLDAYNRTRPGTVTRIPITAEGRALNTPVVEASFDDGGTWQALQVRRAGTGWTTSVTNPATPGHVTLRATATGPAGIQVQQTITRAYAVQN
ncbi:serine protease [Sphaerisporangium siamense]|uniref:Subtilisin family serine protease n=1 Tax=Sphaerisporangium siamense TaxID=795645 RepID=A0A7W7DCH4_9ACTN|nr:S8 family serine peptidase [Sphaerisporangium siamense]MBB4702858.1 subtilisin family serine protease [Sphaerisporangium siamense]GII83385.1 serine protease [Sphaerisporangium siamense]